MFLFIQAYIMCLIPCVGETLRDHAGANMAKYAIGHGIVWLRNIMYLSSFGFLLGWYFDLTILMSLGCFLFGVASYRLIEGAHFVCNNLSYPDS